MSAPSGSKLDLNHLLSKQLTERGAEVSNEAQAVVSAEAQVGEMRGGVRPVEVVWTVRRGEQVLGTLPYRSVISDSVPNSWALFGEAAAESAAVKIADMLRNTQP
jgi:hypothetical protein